MKILVVEDDRTSRQTAQSLLSRLGTCDTAINGAEAVTAFTSAWQAGQPYELICLDIMMPEMDGHMTLKQIRCLENQKGIRSGAAVKVIMLTALNDPRSVIEAFYRGGATAYLVKPIDWDKLLSELCQLGLIAPDAPLGSDQMKMEQR
jgi:two-component system chemotaxis response regulator CheY